MSASTTTEVKVLPGQGEDFRLTIRTPDVIGLLSVVTGYITSCGMDVTHAQVGTEGKTASDTFHVAAPHGVTAAQFENKRTALLTHISHDGIEKVQEKIEKRLIQYLRSRESPANRLFPIELSIDQESSPHETVVRIQSQDTPAFLYELTNALALLGINIVRMEVETEAGRVRDTLWLTQENEKILSEKKLKALQWAILFIKQFTHLLPGVPDPKAALRQFALLGKDLFEREDFQEIAVTLKKSKVLEDLGRVLGTSNFLWEEFIRTQYESIIPIFEQRQLLERPKARREVLRELENAVARKDDYESRVEALNAYKDHEMFRIDLRHILGQVSYVGEFTQEFTDLTEAVVEVAARLAREKVMAKRSEPSGGAYALFGLGKFGGRELGYASDLEVLLVYRDPAGGVEEAHEAVEFYGDMVREFRRIIRTKSEGVFEIDLRLRPYGEDGPLASSVQAFRDYYAKGGGAWNFERQALIKLRYVAGDAALGREIETLRSQFVYNEEPFDFADALKLRVRQMEELVTPGTVNAKYGTGGLLDIEYLVQTLQIAYARKLGGDARHPNTLKAMRALWQAGVVKEQEFQELRACYVFLRNLINALRIVRGHARDLALPPEETEEYIILGRRMGFVGDDRKVRAQFKLSSTHYMQLAAGHYERRMEALAKCPWDKITEGVVMLPETLRISLDDWLRGDLEQEDFEKLTRLGFHDFETSTRHLKHLASHTPAFEHFAKVMDQAWVLWPDVPDADLALQHLQWYAEASSDKDLFWSGLERSQGLGDLLRIFGASRYLADIIIENPEGFSWVRDRTQISAAETRRVLEELRDAPLSLDGLRALRHRETLRLALADLLTGADLREVFAVFSELADFVLRHCVRIAGLENRLSVLALGKLGGCELNFSSDVDLLFLSEEDGDPQELAAEIRKLLNLLKEGDPTSFLYRVDLRLRPHGDDGALFMNLADYRHYYHHKAEPWEFQALLKLRHVAGRRDWSDALAAVVAPLVWRREWPAKFWSGMEEVKKRYEDRTRAHKEWEKNIKMGYGGIRDIEFSVQRLQMMRGGEPAPLRTGNTLAALEALEKENALPAEEIRILRDGYLLCRRIENRLQLYWNRQEFNLPEEERGLGKLARSLGYTGADAKQRFVTELETKRNAARKIFERIYFQHS